MNELIPPAWRKYADPKLLEAPERVIEESGVTYPPREKIFRALELPPEDVRLVILGQDPYHNGNATGRAFEVAPGAHVNPSLKNIYRELVSCGVPPPSPDGNLDWLVDLGVLLLNAGLTVEKGNPASHSAAWAPFSERLIAGFAADNPSVRWLLMGGQAHAYETDILKAGTSPQNIFRTTHPSPFSAYRKSTKAPAFIGSGCFRILKDLSTPSPREAPVQVRD